MKITTKMNRSTKTLDSTMTITDPQDVDDLIRDIRQAATKSRRTGGAYDAHRKEGTNRIIFEVHLK